MVTAKELKEFIFVNGELYFRGTGGILTRAISEGEAKQELKSVNDLSCGNNGISFYRRLQRQGYYWPSMAKDTANIQRSCSKCQQSLDVDESLFIQEAIDWRQLYLDFFQHRLLPSNQSDAIKIRRK